MKRLNFPYIIWWAIAVHFAWGSALLLNETVRTAAALVGLHGFVSLGVGSNILGVILIVACVTAALGLTLDNRISQRQSLLMLMPQYALLVAAAIADFQTIVTGQLNGLNVDRWLLTAALWPVIIGAVLHSCAIVERYHLWNRRSVRY